MTIAVTGASGFVGKRLVASLAADGAKVRALVPSSAESAPLAALGVDVVTGDVRDAAAVARLVDGCRLVYHLAALVPGAGRSRADYHGVNVEGTAQVVRAAGAAGVEHLVHCSTVAVHGSPRGTMIDERTPAAPVNAYQRSKLAAEEAVRGAARAHRLSAVVARLTALYGPDDRRCLRLFRDVARGRVTIIGDGSQRTHLTYVDDAVAGLELCATRVPSDGDCFLLGADERPTLAELVHAIAAELGGPVRIVCLPAAPFRAAVALYRGITGRFAPVPGRVDRLDFFLADQTYDTAKARRELGFVTRVSLREGIRRTAASYRAAGLI